MRRLRYELIPGVGIERAWVEGTVIDLLFEIPYLIWPNLPFPTEDELNGVLAAGVRHTGMSGGCRWEPFQLSTREYSEVVRAIEVDKRFMQRRPGSADSTGDTNRTVHREIRRRPA